MLLQSSYMKLYDMPNKHGTTPWRSTASVSWTTGTTKRIISGQTTLNIVAYRNQHGATSSYKMDASLTWMKNLDSTASRDRCEGNVTTKNRVLVFMRSCILYITWTQVWRGGGGNICPTIRMFQSKALKGFQLNLILGV
jgi:hypothetical protein